MILDQPQPMDVDMGQSPNGKTAEESVRLRGHKLSLTCICIDSGDKCAFTGSKDGSIIKWCLKTRKILAKVNSISAKGIEENKKLKQRHHTRHIYSIAISSDDKFLATGGWDKLIRIWSPEDLSWIHTFKQHRQEITALSFKPNHPTLYSGSADRSVMLWTLEDDDNKCFIEALYGHESAITSIDSGKRDRILTSGGRDQSIRVWKVVEQAQTVFESKHESVDIVKYVNDKIFVSGGEDGAILVWTMMKRAPVFALPGAHKPSDACGDIKQKLSYWISSLAVHPLCLDVSNKSSATKIPAKKKRKTGGDGGDFITSKDASDNEDEFGSDDEEDADMNDFENFSGGPIALLASGSCDSHIKIWRLIKKGSKMCLESHQVIECPGFVNDLRFTKQGDRLVAACGQEHKFGRWWKLKGTKNSIRVFDVDKIPIK